VTTLKGSIRFHGDGRPKPYEVVIEHRDRATDARIQRTKSFQKQRDAKRYLAEQQSLQVNGLSSDPSKQTVGELLNVWLELVVAPKVSPKTLENYEGTIRNHLIQGLGATKVQKVTAAQLDIFYGERRKAGCSEAVLEKCHQRIHQALDYACRLGTVSRNAADMATAPHAAHREMATWSLEQAHHFIAMADHSAYGPIWHLALGTGMRRGEVLGVRWQDIDLDKGTLRVHQTVISLKTGPYTKPSAKTPSGRRVVGIPHYVVRKLEEHKAQQIDQRSKHIAVWTETNLVFTTSVGTCIDPSNLPRDYDRIVKLANVPRIRVHDLRHTYTALALEQGANLISISRQLGHARPSTTSDMYGHVSAKMQQEVTDTIGAALFPDASNETSRELEVL
jgi:integrase